MPGTWRRCAQIGALLLSMALGTGCTTAGAFVSTPFPTSSPYLQQATASETVLQPTLTLQDDPTLAPFTPEFACQLENRTAISYSLCQTQRVSEVPVASEGDLVFSIHDSYFGFGCFTGMSATSSALRMCDLQTGEMKILLPNLYTGATVFTSPDRESFVVAGYEAEAIWNPHVYRIWTGNGNVVQLDQFPECVAGAVILDWSGDGHPVEVSLWTGLTDDYRYVELSDDGSGEMRVVQRTTTHTAIMPTSIPTTSTVLPPSVPTPALLPTPIMMAIALTSTATLPPATSVPTYPACL